MRNAFSVFWKSLAAIVALLGGGCSSALENALETPTPNSVFEYVKDFEERTGRNIVTASDYIFAGIIYVDHYCENFFNELEIQKRELAYYNSVSNKVFTSTITLLPALTSHAKKPQAVLAALAGLSTLAFEQYDKQFNFAPYSVQLRRLILQAQDTLKLKIIPEEFAKIRIVDVFPAARKGTAFALTSTPADGTALGGFFLAHQVVQQYSKTCTIPQMQLFLETALNSANAVASAGLDTKKTVAFEVPAAPPAPRGVRTFTSPPFVAR